MAIGLHNVALSPDKCALCLEQMDDIEDVKAKGGNVAHDGNGILHPMHRECIEAALANSSKCPVCRVELKANSLKPLKENAVTQLNTLSDDAYDAAVVGLAVAAFVGLAVGAGTIKLLSKIDTTPKLTLIALGFYQFSNMVSDVSLKIAGIACFVFLSKTIMFVAIGSAASTIIAKVAYRNFFGRDLPRFFRLLDYR